MRRDGDRQCRVTIVRQDGGFRFSICLRTAIRGLDTAQADGPPGRAINATEARGLGRSSGFSFPMYCRIRASSRPAVQAKYPGGRKCDPPKLRLRSLYARPVIYAHGLDASLSPAKPRAPLAHTPRPCDTKTRSLMVANNSSADTVVAAYAAHLLMVRTVMLCGFITIMSRVGAVGIHRRRGAEQRDVVRERVSVPRTKPRPELRGDGARHARRHDSLRARRPSRPHP